MRIMPFAALAASLLLAGCFTSQRSLYDGEKPVTPLHGGIVYADDPKAPKSHKPMTLDLGGDATYQLTSHDKDGSAEVTRFRLYPLGGTPLLVAEASVCKTGDRACKDKADYNYVFVRVLPDRVEWASPDCSQVLSKLAGVRVHADPCQFFDRAALEKALHIAAAEPWKADNVYTYK